ncbi:Acid phosphatase/vanadium-dependent haloperoxidase-related protein [Striga hermonthica]|uniref:Acid phosphatase/vanadium-dependent haloperoxidase-related protein n=1 Tax=Striga hermonthica TaxID=68872 RepID=A0A9N7RIX5_STRHE|nr:Acid phosphatase/vanadium-dependent haloperoxidase-related protein [Striga hermonthica]
MISSPLKALSFVSFPKPNALNRSSLSPFRFRIPRRFWRPTVIANCSNPQNRSSKWSNYGSPLKPFSNLLPFFQKVRDFTAKSSGQRPVGPQESEFLQNGAFGAALMSVTASAKVKISPIVATLAANPTFVSGMCAWAVAQSIKVFLNFCVERKWDFRLMFASGGMPSSHSALCMALTTSVAICHGVADSLFPVCLGFSLIVMYDAIGVRRHAGMQAQVLNLIVEDLFQGHPIRQRKLKELLGHTPSQVFAGAVLGILVACMCCQVSLFPV